MSRLTTLNQLKERCALTQGTNPLVFNVEFSITYGSQAYYALSRIVYTWPDSSLHYFE